MALLLSLMGGSIGIAQPICSIDIGNDRTICQGGQVTLYGPPGYTNYLWSTGETTQNITVTTADDYWCQVSYPSGELVFNGNFSSGNTGFTSQYTYSLFTVQNEGYYTVGPNASWYHTQFQGTGDGNFLIANGGYGSWVNNQVDVWCQTIPSCPGQTYTLSFRGRTLTNELPARVVWVMDGVLAHWPDFTFPAFNAGWQTYTTSWTAGPNQTSVNACIRVTSGDGVGDDFGLDDISISGMVYLRDTVEVTVVPNPVVDLGPDQTRCAGDEIDLDATLAGATYLWQDGSTGPTFHVAQGGTYSVDVTRQGCTGSDQVTVQYNPIPVVDLGPDRTICPGDAATLDATTAGATYLWSSGETTASITTDQAGTHSVLVDVDGCVAHDTVEVAVQTLHTVDLGPDQNFCAGGTARIGAQVPGAGFAWNNGAITDSITVSNAGIYWVDATLNGCTVRDSIQLGIIPLPLVDLGADQQICPGATLVLDATTPGGSYLWNTGATTPAIDVGAGTWSVDVTVNGCSATGAISVSEYPAPVVDLGPDVILCPGGSVTLDATQAGATYAWNTGQTGPTVVINSATTASVILTDVNGCTATDTVIVAMADPGAVDLGPDVSYCNGSSVQIGTTLANATYLWNTGATNGFITVNTPGIYWLDVLLSGCTVRDSIQVDELPVPAVSLTGGLIVCPGAVTTLEATTPGATYLWSNGAMTSTVDATAGNWSVDVTVDGCTGSAATNVDEHVAPVVDLGPDLALCPGGTLVLDAAQPGTTYLWSTGETTAAITADGAATISVTVTDGHGCTGSDTVNISVVDLSAVDLGPDLSLCPGETAMLDATLPGASGYQWSDGSTGPTISTGLPGTYWVDVLMGTCSISDTITLTGLVAPAISLGNDTTLCPGASLLLEVMGPGLQLEWQDGSQQDSFWVDQAGLYQVVATAGNGCRDTASVQVDYLLQNGFSLGADTTICTGSSLVLDAGLPNGSTQWSGASSATDPVLQVSLGGTYMATTTIGGCAFSDTIMITVAGPPVIDLGADTLICAGSSLTLYADGSNLVWDNGSTGHTRVVTAAGSYWVQSAADGCTVSDTIQVALKPLPAVQLGPDTSFCGNAALPVNAAVPGGSYLWNDGSTLPVRTLGVGTWQLFVTVDGCSASDSVTVQSVPFPMVSLPPDTILCVGESWLIDVAQDGATYQWTTGSQASSLTVDGPGSYGVTVDRNGCATTASVQVAQVDLSGFSFGPDTTLCPGSSLSLSIDIPGAGVVWQDGSTALQRTIATAGEYQATVSVGHCTTQAGLSVGFVPVPAVNLGDNRELCPGDTIWLSVDPGPAQTLWNEGSTDTVLAVTAPGYYAVTLGLDGCSATDGIHVLERPVETRLNLGPDSEICPGARIRLDASMPDATSFLWNNGSTEPALYATGPGLYEVQVSGHCIEATGTIRLTAGVCEVLVHVPNAFTPDGDDLNEIFLPVLEFPVDKWTFRIFNRWGQLIFATETPDQGWDGTHHGKPVPVGVYVWDLHYEGGAATGVVRGQQRGHVTLLR